MAEFFTFFPNLSRLLGKNLRVFQSKQRAFAIQDTDVVGRAHFVDFSDQRLRLLTSANLSSTVVMIFDAAL